MLIPFTFSASPTQEGSAMLVRCPKCRTTFKVSDDLLKGSAPAFRCSRCKHTFELESNDSAELAPDPATVGAAVDKPGVDQELSLPFESKRETAGEPAKNDEMESAPGKAEDSPTDLEPTDRWSLNDPGRDDEQQFVLPQSNQPIHASKVVDTPQDFHVDDPFFPKLENTEGTDDDANNILAISSYREQNVSILPFITLFGLLVIGFSLVSVISYAKPQASEGVIKKIPLVGSSVLKNDYLKDGILLRSLRSGYQTIQGNREVFLISGVAVNQNPVVVREVQLSGIAYNDAGKELEKQTIWVGNTISPKILRGMTMEDIPHLQNLKPLKSFEIPPGDSIPFTIVFLKSAKTAKEFSCDVLTAEGAV
jgi:predicted Zn finger-like uncharacterized protein